MKSNFEIELTIQKVIEFLKVENKKEALVYLKTRPIQMKNESFELLKKCMGCILIYPNYKGSPYEQFFHERKLEELAVHFSREFMAVYGFHEISLLEKSVQSGLSCLKTPFCYKDEYSKRDKCPICHSLTHELAKDLPMTHKISSMLICRISNEIMDGGNPPVALPNGQIYSLKVLSLS